MSKKTRKIPVTAAVRMLRAAGVAFEPFLYPYEEHGGTRTSSEALGVDEHRVIKTLVMEDEAGRGLVVLMHGDCEVATGLLAKAIGCKRITPCQPAVAQKHSGYQVGGTSPFGLRHPLRIYGQASIRELESLWINGGKRGFLVCLTPADLTRAVEVEWVEVAQPG